MLLNESKMEVCAIRSPPHISESREYVALHGEMVPSSGLFS